MSLWVICNPQAENGEKSDSRLPWLEATGPSSESSEVQAVDFGSIADGLICKHKKKQRN